MADNLLDKASILLTPTAYNDGSMLSIKPENGDGDFDFQRNSAATRVNAQGLVENVQIISSELVSNGGFSNGSTDWTLGTGWSIGENKAISDATQGYITQTNVGGAGVTSVYKVQWTQNITVGTRLRFFARNYNDGGTITTLSITRDDGLNIGGGNCVGSGTFTAYVSSTNGYSFKMLAENGVEADITNVSAVEFDEDTNLPRIDYTDGCGSWLLEPQSTNLIQYSEDFSQGYWSKIGSSISPNVTISPDGTQNASKLVEDNLNGLKRLRNNAVSTSGDNTLSFFVKSAERNWILLREAGQTGAYAYFDLENGVIGQSSSAENINIEQLNNDWYKISFKDNLTYVAIELRLALSDGVASYQGDGVSGIYIYGAQVEEQSFSTSYIPTNGATSTRLQDIANNSGNSSLINSTEGVLYAEISALVDDQTRRDISISDGSNTNTIRFHYHTTSNTIRFQIRASNSTTVGQIFSVTDIKDFHKVAISYKSNDVRMFIDGVKVGTDTSATIPSGLDELSFNQGGVGQPFYGKAKALAVYKEALTDEELQALTTI